MIRDFDGPALFRAMEMRRQEQGLTWSGVVRDIWDQHAALNAARHDHPIAASTITGLGRRGDTSCQHGALFVQWLGTAPEAFLVGWTADSTEFELPPARPDRRLRWNLDLLAGDVESRRKDARLTWADAAAIVSCTPSQLQGIKRARYAIGMGLAMRVVQWLEAPARSYMTFRTW